MAHKPHTRTLLAFAVALSGTLIGAGPGLSEDWSSLRRTIKATYAKFETEIKDIVVVQEMTMPTPEGTVSSHAKLFRKGKKFREETTMQMPQMPKEMKNMETIIIYDGKDTWQISSFTGKVKLSEEEGTSYQAQKNWWNFLSENAQLKGIEKIMNRDCYVVDDKGGKEAPFTRIWIDKGDLVLVKAESKGPRGEKALMVCSDFRKIKGEWEWPYKTELYADSTLSVTAVVASLEIDKGLSDDLFHPDKVVIKGSDVQEMMKGMMHKGMEKRVQ